MKITSVSLENFRNYKNESFEFDNGLNIIYGKNASGKTNLVEGICMLALGKSPRTRRDKELITWGETSSLLRIHFETDVKEFIVEMHIDGGGQKRIRINNVQAAKLSDLIGNLHIVYFSPAELKMMTSGPDERRRFMDVCLAQQNKAYFHSLSRYTHILAQRNKSIKTLFNKKDELKDMLGVWDTYLARDGAVIIKTRYEFLENLLPKALAKHRLLSEFKEVLELKYESLVGNATVGEMEKEMLSKYGDSVEKDISLGYTSIGPHRDDIEIFVDGHEIKKFGSQGQQRTATLALKLAEAEIHLEDTNDPPVVILDDVLSELDIGRRNMLLRETSKYQTLVTCTNFDENRELVKNRLHIVNGRNVR